MDFNNLSRDQLWEYYCQTGSSAALEALFSEENYEEFVLKVYCSIRKFRRYATMNCASGAVHRGFEEMLKKQSSGKLEPVRNFTAILITFSKSAYRNEARKQKGDDQIEDQMRSEDGMRKIISRNEHDFYSSKILAFGTKYPIDAEIITAILVQGLRKNDEIAKYVKSIPPHKMAARKYTAINRFKVFVKR